MTSELVLFCIVLQLFGTCLMFVFFRLHRITVPNVTVVLFISHILLQLIAATYLAFTEGSPTSATFLFAASLAAALIPIGALIGHGLFPVGVGQIRRFRTIPPSFDEPYRRRVRAFYCLLLFACGALLLIYVSAAGTTPLLGLISGEFGAEAVKAARREASAGSVGYLFGIGLRFLMPLLFVLSLACMIYFRGDRGRAMYALGLLVALIYNAWGMDKTPVASLFAASAMMLWARVGEHQSLSHRRFRLRSALYRVSRSKRRVYIGLILLGALAFVYPAFIYFLKPAGEHGFAYVIRSVVLRLAYNPALNNLAAFQAFTDGWDFTYFRDVKSLADLMGWKYFDMSAEIAVFKGQERIVNAPPPAIGTFFAQGGWPILAGGVIFASATFKIVENIIYHSVRKGPVQVSLYALLLYGAFRFSWANFHTILVTECIAPVLLILAAWTFVARIRLRKDSHC